MWDSIDREWIIYTVQFHFLSIANSKNFEQKVQTNNAFCRSITRAFDLTAYSFYIPMEGDGKILSWSKNLL